MPNDAWTRIRALRAAPPLLAEDPERRAVFSAALQQSEELFAAARVVGPASKPLPLFYALSQAGRAISAAHNPDDATWAIKGHGLTVHVDADDIRTAKVKTQASKSGNDAVSAVTAALGSSPMPASTTLAELAAGLPELLDQQWLCGDATRALPIVPEVDASHWWEPSLPAARGNVHLQLLDGADVDARMARYADVAGYQVLVPPQVQDGYVTRVLLSWPYPRSAEPAAWHRTVRHMHEVAEHVDGRWYLRPRLGGLEHAPDRLLVWWALLLALSSHARYQPAQWLAALDVDRSRLAVDLEDALRIAEHEVPVLIRSALGSSGQVPQAAARRLIAEAMAGVASDSVTEDPADDAAP